MTTWRFDRLVDEGLALIPAHAPAWTNHNPSDPGITLVELLAYFTEVLAYRLGRVPPEAKLQFLRLLEGVHWSGWKDLAEGGAEAIDRAVDHAVRKLGQCDCAVTAADFEWLAVEAARSELGPSARVRALCVAGVDLEAEARSHRGRDLRAHMSVVLVPRRELDEDTLARLCATVRKRLEPHCLLGTRLHVIGSVLLHAGIGFRVALRAGASWQAVQAAIAEKLRRRWGPWSDEDPVEQEQLPGAPLHLMDLTQMIDATEGVDFVEQVTLRALSRHVRDLHEPQFRVGLQIGVHSTLALDARLGVAIGGPGARRLVRDEAGRLVSLILHPWEQLRLHLMPEAVHPLGTGTREGRE